MRSILDVAAVPDPPLHIPFWLSETSKFHTAQKMELSIKDISSKCDQVGWELQISSHLLKESLMKNFIFCGTNYMYSYYISCFMNKVLSASDQ